MTTFRRFLLAAVVAPLCAPLVLTATELLFSGYPYSAPGHIEKFLHIAQFYFLIGYLAALGLGALIVLVLKRMRRLTILDCILWAALAGACAGLAFIVLVDGMLPSPSVLSVFAILSAFAAVLDAVTFGIIAGLPLRRTDVPVGRIA